MSRATRLFIVKHPCDDMPTIMDVSPDPRTGDERFTPDGPDYSGWYVRETRWKTLLRYAIGTGWRKRPVTALMYKGENTNG